MSTVDTEDAIWDWERRRLQVLGEEDARTHAQYVAETGDNIALPKYLALRAFWRALGGTFHGPNVETGKIPEAKLMPLLKELYDTRSKALAPSPSKAS